MKVIDYFNSGEEFNLVESDELKGLLRTMPPLSEPELERYYKGDYISHENKKKTLFEKAYTLVQKYNLRQKWKLLQKHHPTMETALDYGCGKGDFVHYLSGKGIEAYGYEPGEQAKKNFLKQNKDHQLLSEIEGHSKFDVITLFHVLEHVPNFKDTIEVLKKSLSTDGVMILALPNYKSFDAQYYQDKWAAYDVPRHQWHFTRESIEDLASGFGMNLVNTYPMFFDSFYVSMISEKYKNSGILGLVRGVGVGMLSNIKAWSTKEYSSVMYVLKLK